MFVRCTFSDDVIVVTLLICCTRSRKFGKRENATCIKIQLFLRKSKSIHNWRGTFFTVTRLFHNSLAFVFKETDALHKIMHLPINNNPWRLSITLLLNFLCSLIFNVVSSESLLNHHALTTKTCWKIKRRYYLTIFLMWVDRAKIRLIWFELMEQRHLDVKCVCRFSLFF